MGQYLILYLYGAAVLAFLYYLLLWPPTKEIMGLARKPASPNKEPELR